MPDLIPAEVGIFDRHPEKKLDSGFRRNDGALYNYETVYMYHALSLCVFVAREKVIIETPTPRSVMARSLS